MQAARAPRTIDVPVNRVTSIIGGQRAVTADTVLRLGDWFGTSPEFWLNLQKLHESRLLARGNWRPCEKAFGPLWVTILEKGAA